MKRSLLALALALLPLVAAAQNPVSPAASQAEQRAAEYACLALARPLPGGGTCCVAGGGEVMRAAHYWAQKYPDDGIGNPVAVPQNRVTRALHRPEALRLPPDWYDDKYKPLWADDAVFPADKVLDLWYAALETLEIPISWFCDEAGEHLVIVSGEAANCLHYKMYVYQWNAERKAFARRGVYGITSRHLALIPTRGEFLPEGMRVSVLGHSRAGNSLEYRHLFRYANGNDDYRFPDEEMRWKF